MNAAPDPETRLHDEHHESLRLWLRLLTCTLTIERRVRARLRERFAMTLPRFDLMAQLERNPHGLKMGELSHRLMVTSGNVTGLTDQLVREGLVERTPIPADRRAFLIKLTAKGKRAFDVMAAEHEGWVVEMFSGLSDGDRDRLHALLGRLKKTMRAAEDGVPGKGSTDMSMNTHRRPFATYRATHFRWDVDAGAVATITLNRPARRNPLTFDSYAELRDLFRGLVYASDVKCVVVAGAGGNFSSGGDVHEIIGPLTKMAAPELLAFTRMTGDLVLAMRRCPQPIVAAIDGTCAGAGAMIALASDIRFGTPAATTAFLFVRVGLAGCDMGACTLLPRTIGQGRASELLYTGRAMTADEGLAWGFYNRLVSADALLAEANGFARALAEGPTFAHAMTKKLLHHEWAMDLDAAIEAEAEAQALCMQTKDFHRAFEAFAAKKTPKFEGN